MPFKGTAFTCSGSVNYGIRTGTAETFGHNIQYTAVGSDGIGNAAGGCFFIGLRFPAERGKHGNKAFSGLKYLIRIDCQGCIDLAEKQRIRCGSQENTVAGIFRLNTLPCSAAHVQVSDNEGKRCPIHCHGRLVSLAVRQPDLCSADVQ